MCCTSTTPIIHTSIVYICACVSIVLEELSGGTLSDVIKKRTGGILLHRQALDIALQLACALHHLQEDLSPFAMIIHRGTVCCQLLSPPIHHFYCC